MIGGRSSALTALAIAAVLLLAFGLRVYRIDGQSLWADEGASVVMTYRSPAEIAVAAAGDIHPPLYYLVLRAWAEVAGRTEFALRYLSLVQGVLVVALAYRIGRALLDRPAALLGALFAAGSPLLIHYSQEARMYGQMTLLGTLAIAGSLALWRGGWRLPLAAGAALAFAGAVLSQYFGVTAMVGASLAFVLLYPNPVRCWRAWVGWAGVQIAAIALVLPWVLYASGQLRSWTVETEPVAPAEFLLRTLRYFTFGLAWDQTVTDKTLALAAGVLALALLWPLARPGLGRRSVRIAAVVALAAAAPLTLFAVSLNRPVYNPKFLLIALPAFALLQGAAVAAAAGIARRLLRPRPLAALAAAVAVVGLVGAEGFAVGRSLLAAYHDPKYARDDYRGLVRFLAASARPGDVVVLNAPGQREIWDYYDRGGLPVVGLPSLRPPDDVRTERDLAALTARYRRVWVVFWASEQADPRGRVEGWLNEHTFRAFNRWFGGVRLVLYSVPVASAAGAIQFPERSSFEQGIDLLGYSLATPESRPGEALQLTLFWQGSAPIAERYTVFTHLIDDRAELIWGQRDSEPASGARPTSGWQPGEAIADRYGIPVLPGTPPGAYYVEIGLYRAADGRRLGVLDGGRVVADRVLLGPVTIARPDSPPSLDALLVERPLDSGQGPLRLVGADFHKLGFDRGAVDFRPGDLGHLTLYWRAERRPGGDRRLRIDVRDGGGRSVLGWTREPTNGLHPTGRWEAGEVVRDQHKLPLDLPPGRYRLVAGLEGEPPAEVAAFEVR